MPLAVDGAALRIGASLSVPSMRLIEIHDYGYHAADSQPEDYDDVFHWPISLAWCFLRLPLQRLRCKTRMREAKKNRKMPRRKTSQFSPRFGRKLLQTKPDNFF